jgi:HlyD family secretion protein
VQSEQKQELKKLSDALADHSIDGIDLLTSEPSKLIHGTIVLIAFLLLCGFTWSFIGRADVIVRATGRLIPDSEVRRIYAPVGGVVADIYVAEGQPVSRGDVLMRLNARDAIQLASNAMAAQLQLATAQRDAERFTRKQLLMKKRVEALQRRVDIARTLHEKRVVDGMAKIVQGQRARLEEATGNVEKAQRAVEVARAESAKFQRLFNMEGGGGVSRDQMERARSALVVAEADHDLARARLDETESLMGREAAEAEAKIQGSDAELVQLEIERDSLVEENLREEQQVTVALRRAKLNAKIADLISFDNIDEDNFLRIVAPVDGTITQIAYTQEGDKVQPNTPLAGIVPKDARPVFELRINESDRAFLRVGQIAKIKVNAFPYQRYGFLVGKLEYVSPTTSPAGEQSAPTYKGRVGLEQYHFEVEGEQLPLRFGMEAQVEIVVRKRRLIDLALDPFRRLKG